MLKKSKRKKTQIASVSLIGKGKLSANPEVYYLNWNKLKLNPPKNDPADIDKFVEEIRNIANKLKENHKGKKLKHDDYPIEAYIAKNLILCVNALKKAIDNNDAKSCAVLTANVYKLIYDTPIEFSKKSGGKSGKGRYDYLIDRVTDIAMRYRNRKYTLDELATEIYENHTISHDDQSPEKFVGKILNKRKIKEYLKKSKRNDLFVVR